MGTLQGEFWQCPPLPSSGENQSFIPPRIVLGGVFCLCPQLYSLVLNTVLFYNNARRHPRNTHYNIMLAVPLGTFSVYLGKLSWPNDFIYRKGSPLKYVISCINCVDKFGLIFLGIRFSLKKKKDTIFFFQCCFLLLLFSENYISI